MIAVTPGMQLSIISIAVTSGKFMSFKIVSKAIKIQRRVIIIIERLTILNNHPLNVGITSSIIIEPKPFCKSID